MVINVTSVSALLPKGSLRFHCRIAADRRYSSFRPRSVKGVCGMQCGNPSYTIECLFCIKFKCSFYDLFPVYSVPFVLDYQKLSSVGNSLNEKRDFQVY